MKEHYTAAELAKIKKVLNVFEGFIAETEHIDIVFSKKAGYLMIPLDEGEFSCAVEVEEIASAEDLCDLLLYEVCNDLMEKEGIRFQAIYECSPALQEEARRQMQIYLKLLPEYTHLMEQQFENLHEMDGHMKAD